MKIFQNRNYLILSIIVITASILRLYRLDGFSLSNDELSALSRVQFNSISEVIEKGVIEDFHPAGVQVFLYFWVKLFGSTPLAIRFPFALMGIFSVILVFFIGRNWFNETVGLLSSTAIGFLQFPLLYSQLERPYSSGLFLSLLMIYYWTKLLFKDEKNKKIIHSLAYALSTAGCMFNHYFSFLFAIIVGISGLFFMKKKNILFFLGAGILAVFIFLPHLSVTITQISRGGLSEWLGKPLPDTFQRYLYYIFNESNIVFTVFSFVLLLTVGAILYQRNLNKFYFLSISWFIIPFIIAYYYSIHINPVYQHSIMIFSMPFLILFCFSGLTELSLKWNGILVFIFSSIIIYSTLIEKQYYRTQHWPEFKKLAESIYDYNKELGAENITQAGNYNNPFYLNYYLKLYNEQYQLKKDLIENTEDIRQLDSIVQASTTDYFCYTWSCRYNFPEAEQCIRKKYPLLVKRESYYMDTVKVSEFTLFKKGSDNRRIILEKKYGFKQISNNQWKFDSNRVRNKNDSLFYEMNADIEYSPTFSGKVDDVYVSDRASLEIETTYELLQPGEVILVLSFDNEYGSYVWFGKNIYEYTKTFNRLGQTFISFPKPSNAKKDDLIKIYLWNKSKSKFNFYGINILQHEPD